MKAKWLLFALSLSVLSITTGQAKTPSKIHLPDLGDSSGRLISPAQEKILGAAFFRSLQAQLRLNDDLEIEHYIQSVGQRLVAKSDSPQLPFHFFVVLDKRINAFAGPGGYIGINSGLFLLTDAESELASVMAHEVAHVTQRHLYRAFESASRLSLPMAAATIAAILIGTQNPELAQAALIAIQAGNMQHQINFTRDNEQEADRVGMQTLADALYNPRSMPSFFEHLQQSSRFYGRGIPEYLRTHPVTLSRISDTRGRSEKYHYQQYPNSITYLLIRAKLRVINSDKSNTTLNYFKAKQTRGTPQQRAVARYGSALAHLKLLHFKTAETLLTQLTKQFPHQSHYLNALATTAIEEKNYQKAQKLYQQALQRFPNNPAIKVSYIRGLLKMGQPKTAQKILKSFEPSFRKRALYFELLAQIYADLNQMAQSHRYVAEYYYQVGETQTAILQARLARKSKPINRYLRAILDERLNFFEKELRESRKK
jgi:predicted Zn-dependent protease